MIVDITRPGATVGTQNGLKVLDDGVTAQPANLVGQRRARRGDIDDQFGGADRGRTLGRAGAFDDR